MAGVVTIQHLPMIIECFGREVGIRIACYALLNPGCTFLRALREVGAL